MNTVTVGQVEIGVGAPKIIVSLIGHDESELLDSARRYRLLPCDLIEWRADFLNEALIQPHTLTSIGQALKAILPQPLIFTLRTKAEGGLRQIPPDRYSAANLAMIDAKIPDLIDIELYSGYALFNPLREAARQRNIGVIASNHDFRHTPNQAEIVKRLTAMRDLGADIVKIAVMPQKRKDVLTLISAALSFLETPNPPPVIAVSMGELGRVSRLLAGEFGFAATFASVDNTISAPGQLDVHAVKTVLDLLNNKAML
ncbi:MAG: type I 3-dehydroquinate dehydratase [Burkholderiales bacterium]|jgi:3-dehydroquinate dehydratase-1|nr:type I 3-dehydroquinate dehydratase [Burkholderiales bacterium]